MPAFVQPQCSCEAGTLHCSAAELQTQLEAQAINCEIRKLFDKEVIGHHSL
jgi:hypothetical protein